MVKDYCHCRQKQFEHFQSDGKILVSRDIRIYPLYYFMADIGPL